MNEDTRLSTLLSSALPMVGAAQPSRDLWPLVVARSEESPELTGLDVGLGAGAAIALAIWPDALLLLAYYC